MGKFCRFWVPPLLAGGLLVFAFTGDFRAQEPGEGKGGQGDLDSKLSDSLGDVIKEGRMLHNQKGDYHGTYRLFEGALRTVKPLLAGHPDLQRTITEGLRDVEKHKVPWERGFALRKVLDTVRAGLKGGAMPEKGLDLDRKKKVEPVDAVKPADKKEKLPPIKKKVEDEPDVKKKDEDKKDVKKAEDKDKKAVEKKVDDDKEKGEEKEKLQTPDGATVTGKVTYKGQPLTSGFVTLVDEDGRKFSASIRMDGSYAFRKVAVPPGEYTVVLEESTSLVKGQAPLDAVPERYKSAATSPLRLALSRGANPGDLKLN